MEANHKTARKLGSLLNKTTVSALLHSVLFPLFISTQTTDGDWSEGSFFSLTVYHQSLNFETCKEPKNRFQGTNSAGARICRPLKES